MWMYFEDRVIIKLFILQVEKTCNFVYTSRKHLRQWGMEEGYKRYTE